MTPTAFKEKFQEDLDGLKGGCAAGWNMAPYDAATIYWNNKVAAIERDWASQKKGDVQVGTQTTFIEKCKIANTISEYPPES
ncbi:hypothetical protein GGS24DRAFT_497569 [Hypoxylon argillaceum]|nr:hypothetical protein GGS24DRAFT_497569 [Hypoxylon argillaceum]